MEEGGGKERRRSGGASERSKVHSSRACLFSPLTGAKRWGWRGDRLIENSMAVTTVGWNSAAINLPEVLRL